MESKKQIELIKLSTIGCISEEEMESLTSSMTEDENFPWKELGEYQNLVALLPSALEIETPNWELKDKVARKLYRLKDEIKNRQAEKKPAEEIYLTDEKLVEETEEGVTIEMDDVETKEPDLVQIPPENNLPAETIPETKPAEVDLKSKESFDQRLVEKITKEYIGNYFAGELESINKNIKKSFILSAVLFIVLLLLCVFMFFKFSGDLDSKQEEIDLLKKRLGISYMQNEVERTDTA